MTREKDRFSIRRAARLPGYDYRTDGYYFITICTDQRRCLLSSIQAGTVYLSPLGRIADQEWRRTAAVHRGLQLDAYVIMPNHFHAAVMLNHEATDRPPLGVAISGFKAAVTRRARRLYTRTFEVWQRGYYEHIVRNDQDLEAVRQYIEHNSERWTEDREYPRGRE